MILGNGCSIWDTFSQENIIACAILFNLGRLAREEDEEDDDSAQDTDNDTDSDCDDNEGDEDAVLVIDEDKAAMRHKGQQDRDKMLRAMIN